MSRLGSLVMVFLFLFPVVGLGGTGSPGGGPRVFKDMYYNVEYADGKVFAYTFPDGEVPDIRRGDILWHGTYDTQITLHRVTAVSTTPEGWLAVVAEPVKVGDLVENIDFQLDPERDKTVFEAIRYPDGRAEKYTTDVRLLSMSRDPDLRPMEVKDRQRDIVHAQGIIPDGEVGIRGSLDIPLIHWTDFVIYDGEATTDWGDPVNFAGKLKVVAKHIDLTYTPAMDIGFKVEHGALAESHAQLSATVELKYDIRYEVYAGGNYVYRKLLFTYERWFVPFIGVVPVPIKAEVKVYGVFDASAAASGYFQAGADLSIGQTVGMTWDQTAGWGFTSDITPSATPYNSDPIAVGGNGPSWQYEGHANAELRVEPYIGVYFAGLVGPRIIPTPSLRVSAELTGSSATSTNFSWGLYGCFNAKLEFLLSALADDCSDSNGLRGEYYNTTDLSGPKVLALPSEPWIGYDWGSGSPYPGVVNPDNFSVRWTGQIEPRYSEVYTFCTDTSDGARLWVDGRLLVDDWRGHETPEEHCGDITLQAGQKYDLKMEYWEGTGLARANLSWQSPTQGKEIVPQGRLRPCAPFFTKTIYDHCWPIDFRNGSTGDGGAGNAGTPADNDIETLVCEPKPTAPVEGTFTGTLRPSFSWTCTGGNTLAEKYQVMVGAELFDSDTIDFTPTEDLRPGIKVPWKVRAFAKGRWGMWSDEVPIDIGYSLGSGDSWYDLVRVGNRFVVTDRLTGEARIFWVYDIDANVSPRQVLLRYMDHGAWTDIVARDKEATRVPGSGLFIYPATVFSGNTGDSMSELLVAPYFEPNLMILNPTGGTMNGATVQVAADYVGKGVPWRGVGNPPRRAETMKTLCYNGACSSNETFTWAMSGAAGPRTMEVTLTDLFGRAITRTVTVSYDPTIPFYAFSGPLGDEWKRFNTSCWNNNGPVAGIKVFRNDGFYLENTMADSTRESEIRMYVEVLSRAVNSVSPGQTGVFVVDRSQYESGTFGSCSFGTATYKELYNALARALGRDGQGRYRVWASASAASRGPSDAILDAAPPALTITSPSSGYVNSATITLAGTATDDYALSKIEVSVDGGGWSLATGTESWSREINLGTEGTHTVAVKATDTFGNTATASASIVYDATPGLVNISYPVAGETLSCTTVSVAGTASDAVGLARVEVRLNHGPWLLASGLATWTVDVNLPPGDSTIEARACDLAGNCAMTSSHLTRVTVGDGSRVWTPLPVPTATDFPNERNIADGDMGTFSEFRDYEGGGSATYSSTYDLGSDTVGEMVVTWLGGGGKCKRGADQCWDHNWTHLYLETSLDGSSWIPVADARFDQGEHGSDSGRRQLSGLFYGRYMRLRGEVYCAFDGSYTTNEASLLIYEAEVRRNLELPLPMPTATDFENERNMADSNIGTAAHVGVSEAQTHDFFSRYDFGSPTYTEAVVTFETSSTPCRRVDWGACADHSWTVVRLQSSFDGLAWTTVSEKRFELPWHVAGKFLESTSSGVQHLSATIHGRYLRLQATLHCLDNGSGNSTAHSFLHVFEVNLSDHCGPPQDDMTPPSLVVSSPPDHSTTGGRTVTVAGTASDGGGVWGIQLRNNGGSWIGASGTTSWSANLALEPGGNAIDVVAFDNAGNMATASIGVSCDEEAPRVSILFPVPNSVVTSPSLTVSGTASDNVDLSMVEVRLNGGAWTRATGTIEWSKDVTLVAGANTIDVRATDVAGNTGASSFAVTYSQYPVYVPWTATTQGWTTPYVIANKGSSIAHVSVSYHDQANGSQVGTYSVSIQPGASKFVFREWSAPGTDGSAVLGSDQPISVIVDQLNIGEGKFAAYEVDPSGSNDVFLPWTATTGGWTTPFVVVNRGAANAAVTITYYDTAGATAGNFQLDILPGASKFVFREWSTSTDGAARVTSTQPISVLVDMLKNAENRFAAYTPAPVADNNVFVPWTSTTQGWTTPFRIVNRGTDSAVVNISYYDQATGLIAGTDSVSIDPNEVVTVSRETSAADGTDGSAVLNSTQPISVIVEQSNSNQGKYEVFTPAMTASSTIVIPWTSTTQGWTSPYVIVNMGSANATVTATYFNQADGSVAGTDVVSDIPPGASRFVFREWTAPGTDGSVVLVSNQPISVVVDQINNGENLFGAYAP